MDVEALYKLVKQFGLATTALLLIFGCLIWVSIGGLKEHLLKSRELDLESLHGKASRRHESTQAALLSLHNERLEVFPELWDEVGVICTPSDPTANARMLSYTAVEDCHKAVVSWYKKCGIFLDSDSRSWTLILREMLAQALNEQKEKAPQDFQWTEELWPRLIINAGQDHRCDTRPSSIRPRCS